MLRSASIRPTLTTELNPPGRSSNPSAARLRRELEKSEVLPATRFRRLEKRQKKSPLKQNLP
nr:MAG TPA: hypothetical protein [Caudoviricetes sp.]